MNASDTLHTLTVAQCKTTTIDMLDHANVGRPIPRDSDVFFVWQWTWHGLAP